MLFQVSGTELGDDVPVLVYHYVWRHCLGPPGSSMSSTSLTFRFVLILSILTVFNIIFLGLSWHQRDTMEACSVDTIVQGITKFVAMSGKFHLDEVLGDPCKKYLPTSETEQNLVSAVRTAISHCNSRVRVVPKKFTEPILTLFSSWASGNNTEKDLVHNISLANWIRLKPKISIVLFSNDSKVVTIGKQFGIQTLPIVHHAGDGAPVLRTMFQTVQKLFTSSYLYGYVNSDILFTDAFLESLEHILTVTDLSVPLFMTGRRTNVENLTPLEAETSASLKKVAKSRGALFGENAEDYFITNKAFPWDKIADVVIGRLAYDNWLVGYARCAINATMIELSDSVLAVHQTTKSGGNFEGFKHPKAHYNEEVLKKAGIKPVYENGFTRCMQSFTYFSFCGDIVIGKRDSFWVKCQCPLMPNITKATTHASNSTTS